MGGSASLVRTTRSKVSLAGAVSGVYIPLDYDEQRQPYGRARRHYYETETYADTMRRGTGDEDAAGAAERWPPASGTVSRWFDDSRPATSLCRRTADALEGGLAR